MGDNANYYQNIAGVEDIDILNDVVKDLPGTQAAMLWNTLKYLLRFQKKNGVEDLKKAQNYLQWLIDEIGAAKDVPEKQSEVLWDTWYSNEYGHMRIFSKSKEPNGRPSKLTFYTGDAAEEFEKVFYRMISNGYDEFSIADVALEMKFKISKGNEWNKWDDLVNWKEVHDSFTIVPVGDKYELIFSYKESCSETAKNYRVLSYKDIADIFGISVVFVCINKDIDVFEKPLSGTMRRFEFQLDRECIYTFVMYKSSSKISPEALVKLHTALVRNVKEKEGK